MLGIIVALLLCKLMAENKPDYATELYQQGMTYALAGDYAKAEQYLTEAIRLEPRSEALWTYRSIARGMLGNVAGAASDWEEAKKWNPEQIKKTIEEAYSAQDWSTILAITEWLLLKKQLAPTGYYYHSCALLGLGRGNEALPYIKHAIEHEHELYGLQRYAHFIYAQVLQIDNKIMSKQSKWRQDAIDQFDIAWELGYQTTELLQHRAGAYWEMEKKDEAIRDVQKAIVLDRKSVNLRILLISFLASTERWKEAKEELIWMKRLPMTASEKHQYSEFVKKLEAIIAANAAKEKPAESITRQSFELEWKSKLPH